MPASYEVILLRRARLGGKLFRLGQRVVVGGDTALRCCWSLCDSGQARPADERTRREVELFGLLRRAIVR